MRYDSIIVGTGPAGLEAAINLKIRRKSFLLIGPESLSRKVNRAPKIDNYLGLPNISGKDLGDAFHRHIKEHDIEITDTRVTSVYHMGDHYAVATAQDLYEASTVILATGVYTSNPYKGEEEFLGRGVGYCATCDAPLYEGKTVTIIGTSEYAEDEANYVSEIAKKVYYVPVGPSPVYLNDEVEVVTGRVQEITGNENGTVGHLVLDSRTLDTDGVFILRESISPARLLPGLESDGEHILVNEHMETNLPGGFAAGDCTGRPYQYIRAAGQGLTAAHSAVSYLAALNKKSKG